MGGGAAEVLSGGLVTESTESGDFVARESSDGKPAFFGIGLIRRSREEFELHEMFNNLRG